ncbi:MAG: molecular chaperone GrpE [Haloarculaceae archaeon]|jgi:molecular chaperone GrpE
MSEQDGAETDGSGSTESTSDGQAADESIEDIAAQPDNPDTPLAEVLEDLEEPTGETSDGPDDDSTPEDVQVEAELVEQIESASAESTARVVAVLRERVENLETRVAQQDEDIEDLESRLKRKQAEFQNYKKRQKERMTEEKRRATEDLVERLVDVRDSLKRALDQEEGTDIRGGVESTLRQFDEQLRRENVEPIEPAPGDEVDPQRHEALATIAASQPEDTIAQVHRPGYEMADKVVRPAQVAVSDGSQRDEADAETDS